MNVESKIIEGHTPVNLEHSVESTVDSTMDSTDQPSPVTLDIYIAQHCYNCAYAYEVADEIRQHFPHVQVRMIDMHGTTEAIPEAVFATPTYLLNGRVWSLGNPSQTKVHETLMTMSVN